jgi:hypothetical protein
MIAIRTLFINVVSRIDCRDLNKDFSGICNRDKVSQWFSDSSCLLKLRKENILFHDKRSSRNHIGRSTI